MMTFLATRETHHAVNPKHDWLIGTVLLFATKKAKLDLNEKLTTMDLYEKLTTLDLNEKLTTVDLNEKLTTLLRCVASELKTQHNKTSTFGNFY